MAAAHDIDHHSGEIDPLGCLNAGFGQRRGGQELGSRLAALAVHI